MSDFVTLDVHTEGDAAFVDTPNMKRGVLTDVSRLREGMQSGRSSVAFRIRLDDGTVVFAETSMRLFQGAASALRAAEERDGLEP